MSNHPTSTATERNGPRRVRPVPGAPVRVAGGYARCDRCGAFRRAEGIVDGLKFAVEHRDVCGMPLQLEIQGAEARR